MKIASLTPKQWATGQLVQIKPKLRGWLHLAATPLSLAASIVLVCLAPTTHEDRIRRLPGVLPHPVRGLRHLPPLLLGAPLGDHVEAPGPLQHLPAHRRHLHAADHRRSWTARDGTILLIASSGAALSPASSSNLFWPHRPALAHHRSSTWPWAGSPSGTCPSCGREAGPPSCGCIVAGGVLYTLGAIVYGTQETRPLAALVRLPRDLPRLCTVAAWACHCVAVYLAVLGG